VTNTNEILISPENPTYNTSSGDLDALLVDGAKKLKSSEGIYQFSNKKNELLVASASVGIGDLKVVSVIPKSAALEAVRIMILKSAFFLSFLFFVTVALSILFSAQLTSSLKKLLNATREIAQGNFKVNLIVRGGDEVSALSNGFNKMAIEIERLLLETVEKSRMQEELKTAQLVQRTLFPVDHLKEYELEIKGFYEPAKECSGDWWYHKKIGDRTLLCIADATGHGVPAALLTASARSAASAIENFPKLTLNEMLSIFNRAIYNTAKGQVMMTMFLGLYDHATGILTYCNASHEPPYLLPNRVGLKKRDIQILHEASGPRLGESEDSKYSSSHVQLQMGDKIIFYTDGVTELKNKAGDMWGERALIKCLIACHNEKKDIVATMSELAGQIDSFRAKHPLQDDLTYFMLERSI
jgi:sigma-B regulation protein RsbU (phosphoserine phosphatase)